jgi:hypothetical protein
LLPPSSSLPGEKGIILVSKERRTGIDRELERPGAPAIDVEAIEADVCIEEISPGRLLVKPRGSPNGTPTFIISEDDRHNQWLMTIARSGRVRLAPSADCADLLRELQGRGVAAPSVWVEEGAGVSRCERDTRGEPHVDPTKTRNYEGVVIMKRAQG